MSDSSNFTATQTETEANDKENKNIFVTLHEWCECAHNTRLRFN